MSEVFAIGFNNQTIEAVQELGNAILEGAGRNAGRIKNKLTNQAFEKYLGLRSGKLGKPLRFAQADMNAKLEEYRSSPSAHTHKALMEARERFHMEHSNFEAEAHIKIDKYYGNIFEALSNFALETENGLNRSNTSLGAEFKSSIQMQEAQLEPLGMPEWLAVKRTGFSRAHVLGGGAGEVAAAER